MLPSRENDLMERGEELMMKGRAMMERMMVMKRRRSSACLNRWGGVQNNAKAGFGSEPLCDKPGLTLRQDEITGKVSTHITVHILLNQVKHICQFNKEIHFLILFAIE